MGCTSSSETKAAPNNPPPPPPPKSSTTDHEPPPLTVRKRRSIFESTDDVIDSGDASLKITVLDDPTKQLLEKALAEYFGIEQASKDYLKLDLFVHSMQREEIAGGTTVLTEGQFSSKLYVIETGYIQITVKSAFVKTVGKGATVGELLLSPPEEAVPLKSTAHCITNTILWSLDKDDLRRIELTASSEMLLRGSLYEYFGVDKYSTENEKIDLFVKSMEREEIKGGTTLIVEGEVGNKLYIIDSGYFQISIKGQFVRTIGKGKVLGDLALLYDAPRSASAHAITDAVVWSLHRDAFRQINIESSSNQFKKRAKWLINCPELGSLNAVNFTRLVNSFQVKEVPEGTTLYLAKSVATDCILIESGKAAVFVPSEDIVAGRSPSEVDTLLGISRPFVELRRKLSRDLVDFINGKSLSLDDIEVETADTRPESMLSSRPESMPMQEELQLTKADAENWRKNDGVFVCEVSDGCLLATGALKQGSESDANNAWKCTNRTWKFADGAWHALKTSYGIQSPITVRTLEPCRVCAFSFEAYDKLLESPEPVAIDDNITEERSEKSISYSLQSEANSESFKSSFDVSMFRARCVLGKGSFAIVLLAELRSDETRETVFALKIYDKKDVALNSQLKNVLRSSHLLRKMNSPFVMRLHGTFQTPHQLYMVLEPLLHGSLWDVMADPPFSKLGLPGNLVQFYVASIVLGLAHVHSVGAAYRELKPENVMLDGSGYPRLVDFGMCKKIPYVKTDARGSQKLFSKSYTLFGTPGRKNIVT